MLWRTTKEELDPKYTVPTVKQGSERIKCWRCFSSSGIGNLVFIDGNMIEEMYRGILDQNLLQSVRKLGMNYQWAFQQDNDPKHVTGLVINWLDRKELE